MEEAVAQLEEDYLESHEAILPSLPIPSKRVGSNDTVLQTDSGLLVARRSAMQAKFDSQTVIHNLPVSVFSFSFSFDSLRIQQIAASRADEPRFRVDPELLSIGHAVSVGPVGYTGEELALSLHPAHEVSAFFILLFSF